MNTEAQKDGNQVVGGPVCPLIRIKEVAKMTGVSVRQVWRLCRRVGGDFPRPRKIGPKTTVWARGEVAAWVEAVIAKAA